MESSIKGPLALLIILLSFIALLYIGFVFFGSPEMLNKEKITAPTFIPEEPSPEVLAMLEKSRGFEVLISYTDFGFEPGEASIAVGESVRFTNNSSKDLWVAAAGTVQNPMYPGRSECGSSLLDTCHVLKPRDFWEFTFEKSGAWMYANNLDKAKGGVVYVGSE